MGPSGQPRTAERLQGRGAPRPPPEPPDGETQGCPDALDPPTARPPHQRPGGFLFGMPPRNNHAATVTRRNRRAPVQPRSNHRHDVRLIQAACALGRPASIDAARPRRRRVADTTPPYTAPLHASSTRATHDAQPSRQPSARALRTRCSLDAGALQHGHRPPARARRRARLGITLVELSRRCIASCPLRKTPSYSTPRDGSTTRPVPTPCTAQMRPATDPVADPVRDPPAATRSSFAPPPTPHKANAGTGTCRATNVAATSFLPARRRRTSTCSACRGFGFIAGGIGPLARVSNSENHRGPAG